jgi:thymidine phosphorylase
MKDAAQARGLAEAMAAIGGAAGVRTECLITAMEQPLGEAVGNALEIKECLALLTGRGPADAMSVVRAISSRMVALGGKAPDAETALGLVERAVSSGAALDTFRRMVEAQGGDPRVVDEPGRLPSVPTVHVVHADRDGYISRMHALSIGRASICLGAGRDRVGDAVDHAVGLLVKAHLGDRVETGQPLLEIHHRDGKGLTEALALCRDACAISENPVTRPPKVLDIVQ